MSESEARFLERLRDEVDRGLGPGIEVVELTASRDGRRTRLVAACRTPIGPWSVDADGRTLVEAAGQLFDRLPEARLAVAFRRVVEETPGRP